MTMVRITTTGALATLLLVSAPVAAQREAKLPKRPKLELQRDSNDWRSYQISGTELLNFKPKQARVFFEWAHRLDPTRAEPLFAIALITEKSEPLREALERDPFMHEGKIRGFRVQGGDPRELFGLRNLGWYDLASHRPDSARAHFREALERWPDDESLVWGLALAYRDSGMPDSAEVLIAEYRDRVRSGVREENSMVVLSLPFFEYMIGRAYAGARQFDQARVAYERALSEDLSYHPAHVGLAIVAMASGDTTKALEEWELAVSLAPADASYRVGYAVLLHNVGRHAESRTHAQAAIEAAPLYPAARLILARALEAEGDADAATSAYRDYIVRAPKVEAPGIAFAQARIDSLSR